MAASTSNAEMFPLTYNIWRWQGEWKERKGLQGRDGNLPHISSLFDLEIQERTVHKDFFEKLALWQQAGFHSCRCRGEGHSHQESTVSPLSRWTLPHPLSLALERMYTWAEQGCRQMAAM